MDLGLRFQDVSNLLTTKDSAEVTYKHQDSRLLTPAAVEDDCVTIAVKNSDIGERIDAPVTCLTLGFHCAPWSLFSLACVDGLGRLQTRFRQVPLVAMIALYSFFILSALKMAEIQKIIASQVRASEGSESDENSKTRNGSM